MGCPLYEVYGQTENTGAAFARMTKDKMAGHVGGIVVIFLFIKNSLISNSDLLIFLT